MQWETLYQRIKLEIIEKDTGHHLLTFIYTCTGRHHAPTPTYTYIHNTYICYTQSYIQTFKMFNNKALPFLHRSWWLSEHTFLFQAASPLSESYLHSRKSLQSLSLARNYYYRKHTELGLPSLSLPSTLSLVINTGHWTHAFPILIRAVLYTISSAVCRPRT